MSVPLKSLVLSLIAAHAVLALGEEPSRDAGNVKLPIGMNLTVVSDWSDGFPFKNLMWGARSWVTRNADGSGPFETHAETQVALDGDGYPLEIPFTPAGATQSQVVFTIIPNRTEAGRYVVLYDGEGDIRGAMETKTISSAPGRVVLELGGNVNRYEGIAVTRSVKGRHVHNIRILRECDEKADLKANPFRDDFLLYCRQWHALRFMEWAQTNNSLEKEWSGRKHTTFYTMIGKGGDAIGRWGKPASDFDRRFAGGVAIEIMIQLANMTKTDPWFCVPHRATPEYMTEFARLVRAKLDPGLKVYLEYSNELWNWSFQQAGWMVNSRIAAEGLAGSHVTGWRKGVVPVYDLDGGDVAKDGGADHPERTGVLVRRCFKCWEEVFTGRDRSRLVRVIGVQHAWLDTAQRTAAWVVNHGGGDALAPAGYIGPNEEIYKRWEAAGASLTANQVMADMNEAFETNSARWTRDTAAVARKFGLRFVVYEGGQHIQSKNQAETPYLPALKAAQYHPGMCDLYLRNFALHQDLGCDLFMAFNSVGAQGSRWGSFGHQERYGQSPAEMPKLRALTSANIPR